MITVEISAAASDRIYEFHLDENTPLRVLTEEIGSMICQKEQAVQEGCDELLLCDVRKRHILSPAKSLAENDVQTGDRLLLV